MVDYPNHPLLTNLNIKYRLSVPLIIYCIIAGGSVIIVFIFWLNPSFIFALNLYSFMLTI